MTFPKSRLGGAMLALLVALLLRPGAAGAQDDYWQQFHHTTIRVRLDIDKHMLVGSERIEYTNNSPDTLREFYLHLYPNGYQPGSELQRDYRRRFNYNLKALPEKYQGWLNIFDVTVDGTPILHIVDDTIALLKLPKPLPPGATMTLEFTFEEKIRQHLGRAGYRGEHYDLAQWYPKVVVYDEEGWHPDKFMTGEFYGEFGTFDVHIELPERFVVAATGVVQDGDPGWSLNPIDGGRRKRRRPRGEEPTKTVHFYAENVHDFAWCADPSFVVQSTTWNGIDVHSVFRASNKAWKDSTLAHAIRALEWLDEKVGRYAYPQVTVVDALLGGGMEYPMLVMDGRADEGLVVHEIGHIYFYGMLGNDERAEAWLDEGFTTFQTTWYEVDRYGEKGITRDWSPYRRLTPQFTMFGNYRQGVFWLQRRGYGERTATRAEDFQNSYRAHVYRKPAMMLDALRYVIGEDDFETALRRYYDRWKFKHVNEARFQAVCEEVSGLDLDLFFEQWLHSRKICDYNLAEVKTSPSPRGDAYSTNVRIEREGEMVMPLELEFTFDDGSTRTARVEGRLRTIKETFDFPERPKKVSLNAKNRIGDIDMSNNFRPRRRAIQLNWPGNGYYPEDAYQIRYHPTIWYNDIDGAKIGLRLNSSYARFYRRISLGLYYGANSGRLDFVTSYTRPLKLFGNNAELEMSGYKMEGRQDAALELRYRIRKTLIKPPTQELVFGFNYHDMTNMSFVVNPETYQPGADFAPLYFHYRITPELDIATTDLRTGLRWTRDWFGSSFDYTSFYTDMSLRVRSGVSPFEGGLRFFLGIVGGNMPYQSKFSLAGGGPLAEEKRFWLRSPGAIWKDARYHEPGGGNLRGFLKGTFGVNQLFATNLEMGFRLPILSRPPGRLWGAFKVLGFADWGVSFDSENPIHDSERIQKLVDDGVFDKSFFDAGVGVVWNRKFPFYDLHLRGDFPFYVNQPQVNGEAKETELRFLWSISATF